MGRLNLVWFRIVQTPKPYQALSTAQKSSLTLTMLKMAQIF
ncbi:Uncharacterised protein [Kluyvera cryocrescens]|uniref:Uncharacterized protein n=1 Tax=Kluyvera cryocrescens TaxID=580 RepID=A0A485CWX6_KLUCR|nr:Uncharacterised protein [Kluyvera cryocrescens]